MELNMALVGDSAALGRDELLSAYMALYSELVKTPIYISAPVHYNEGLRRSLTTFPLLSGAPVESVGMESRHNRENFDITTVRLSDVELLHVAVVHDANLIRDGGSPEYVERLLEARADVNALAHYDTEAFDLGSPSRRLRTAVSPIHLAVDRGSVELVRILLKYNASPETRAVFDMRADYTPLHMAAKRGFRDIAQLLIDAGANAAETDLSGKCSHDIMDPDVELPLPRRCSVVLYESEADASRFTRSETSQPMMTDRSASYRSWKSRQVSSDAGGTSGHLLFASCADSLLRLAGDFGADNRDLGTGTSSASSAGAPSAPGSAPGAAELRRVALEALCGADVNDLLSKPLPEGRHYKRTKELKKGCLLHYATDRAVMLERRGEANPEAVVRCVLAASADVHARAHYLTWGIPHTCTALHIAAAGGAPKTLALLLDASASVEAMVTNDTKPHYTPLLDAASEGHYDACELLLKRKANPNVPNRLGRTCLHNAVLDGRGDLARLLTENGSDVTLADSIFQETPLLCTIRAKETYPVPDMLWLCRAYHDSRYSLLHDLSSLAVSRCQLAVKLLNFVLCDAKGIEPALKAKKEQLLNQIRKVAVEGKRDEQGLTPVDQLATIIESSPQTGVRLLCDVLCDTPCVQDTTHGTLPVYANLRTGQDSYFPWRRWLGTAEPLLTDYQPDVLMRRDGREWPCWLFDSTRPDAEPRWHRRFAPRDSRRYDSGNYMVQMKVLLAANVLDPKIMMALGRSKDLTIFADMPVRGLLSCVYINVVKDILLMEKLLELLLVLTLVAWARLDGHDGVQVHRICWMISAAVPIHDIALILWKLKRYLGHGWRLASFFQGFENPFGLLTHACHIVLLVYTATGDHSLDTAQYLSFLAPPVVSATGSAAQDNYNPYARALLATVIIFRSIKFIMLFSYGDVFGQGILAVYNAFHGVFTMFSIIISCFAAFATAFFVMHRGKDTALLAMVYRGLVLGDDDSLASMEHMWGGVIGNWLTVFGTAVFTIYLLNIMIAVLTAEYYKADRQAPLILWRERALKSAQVLLGPVFPWCRKEILRAAFGPCAGGGGGLPSPSRRQARMLAEAAGEDASGTAVTRRLAASEATDALKMKRLLDLLVAVLCGVTVASLLRHSFHEISGAVAFGVLLIVIRARLLRCPAYGARGRGRRFYLWICHRSDYSRLTFVSEEVEKEHIDELKMKVEGMEHMIRDLHRRLVVPAAPAEAKNPCRCDEP